MNPINVNGNMKTIVPTATPGPAINLLNHKNRRQKKIKNKKKK
jgi:hypothetical protein